MICKIRNNLSAGVVPPTQGIIGMIRPLVLRPSLPPSLYPLASRFVASHPTSPFLVPPPISTPSARLYHCHSGIGGFGAGGKQQLVLPLATRRPPLAELRTKDTIEKGRRALHSTARCPLSVDGSSGSGSGIGSRPPPSPSPSSSPSPPPSPPLPPISSRSLREAAESAVLEIHRRSSRLSSERTQTILLASFVVATLSAALFGKQVLKNVKDKTAEMGSEVIAHERMQIKTSELAAAVVKHVLDDGNVAEKSARFLRAAANNVETQEALTELTVKVLQSPEVLKEVNALVLNVVRELLQHPDTVAQTAALLSAASRDPSFRHSVSQLVVSLSSDPSVVSALSTLTCRLSSEPSISTATASIMTNASHDAMSDPEVLQHMKEFVADVVADDTIQRTGGAALWNTVTYSVRPGTVSVLLGTGAMCVGLAIMALGKGGYFSGEGSGSRTLDGILRNVKETSVGLWAARALLDVSTVCRRLQSGVSSSLSVLGGGSSGGGSSWSSWSSAAVREVDRAARRVAGDIVGKAGREAGKAWRWVWGKVAGAGERAGGWIWRTAKFTLGYGG